MKLCKIQGQKNVVPSVGWLQPRAVQLGDFSCRLSYILGFLMFDI